MSLFKTVAVASIIIFSNNLFAQSNSEAVHKKHPGIEGQPEPGNFFIPEDFMHTGQMSVTHFQSEEGEDLVSLALESYLGEFDPDSFEGQGYFPFKFEVTSSDGEVDVEKARLGVHRIIRNIEDGFDVTFNQFELDYEKREVLGSEYTATGLNIVRFIPVAAYRLGNTNIIMKAKVNFAFGYGVKESTTELNGRIHRDTGVTYSLGGSAGLGIHNAIDAESYYREEGNLNDSNELRVRGSQVTMSLPNFDRMGLKHNSIGLGYQEIEHDTGPGDTFKDEGVVINFKVGWGGSRR